MDRDGSGQLDLDEFKAALVGIKLRLSEEEAENLFQLFDRSGDGLISFNEFLTAMVGEISANRKRLV